MDPASYPANNTEEMQAVIAFLSLLDLRKVKPDVKWLDKVPSQDGSLELVDSNQVTIGDLKVQLKKIPKGALKFDCPTKLVAYSERTSSPFVLICVDVETKKAYWAHVSRMMVGLKADQMTFTVKFQPTIDEIGDGYPYIDRWQTLCDDYLRRISNYPTLSDELTNVMGLGELPTDVRILFQDYVDRLNTFLDVDFNIVSYEFFANTWKLGIKIHRVDEEAVAYSIYNIVREQNTPLLLHEPRISAAPRLIGQDGNEIKGIVSYQLEGAEHGSVSTEWMARGQFTSASSVK